ncbi:MAG: DUF1566 domain-containing protein [Lewinellaceae bacterium]|nr:DUF1566 domain-containing protein [Lewinellaceae bacterium]
MKLFYKYSIDSLRTHPYLLFFIPCILLLFPAQSTYGQCGSLAFDGGNDYINCGEIMPSGAYTKEAWIKIPSRNGKTNNIISGSRAAQHAFWAPPSGGNPKVAAGHNGDGRAGNWNYVVDPNPVAYGQWQHYAVTYDGSSVLILYRNGVEVARKTGVPPYYDPGKNYTGKQVNIGAYTVGNSSIYSFQGSLDEVRVWSVAKTPGDIEATRHRELTGSEPNLVLYVNFNEGVPGGDNTGMTTLANLGSGSSTVEFPTRFAKTGENSNIVGDSPHYTNAASSTSGTGASGQLSQLLQAQHNGKTIYIHPIDNANGARLPWGSASMEYFNANSADNGKENTSKIVAGLRALENQHLRAKPLYVAEVCEDLDAYGYTDWYLPSKNELQAAIQSNYANFKSGAAQNDINRMYWSSTEVTNNKQRATRIFMNWAQGIAPNVSGPFDDNQNTDAHVRCVRKETAPCFSPESLAEVTLPTGAKIIVHPTDNSIMAGWNTASANTSVPGLAEISSETDALADLNGEANSQAILAQTGGSTAGNAAKICDELEAFGYSDWYLPSAGEIKAMEDQLGYMGNGSMSNEYYWSSTQYSSNKSWNMHQGTFGKSYKNNSYHCRCVRRE